MKRMIAMAALFAVAAAALAGSMAQVNKGDTQGVWITGETDATVCLYGNAQGAVLGFYKGNRKDFPKACDFAIASRDREVYFQIADDKGTIHHIPVAALLKLKDLK